VLDLDDVVVAEIVGVGGDVLLADQRGPVPGVCRVRTR
jgi:hypothetical protein